eukprot:RCo036539
MAEKAAKQQVITYVPPPERQLKKHKRRKIHKVTQAKRRRIALLYRRDKKNELIKRFFKYKKYFKKLFDARRRAKKIARLKGNFHVQAEPKIAFVIRIRGITAMPPKPRKILQLLRLRALYNGVFVRLNKATMNMMRIVSPWITWGYPSLRAIRMLLYKRGYVKMNGHRKRITNSLIQRALRKHNIICIEDVIFQLATCGKHFREVNKFLWPFKLRAPKKGLRSMKKHFVEGGDFGNREEYISGLMLRMLGGKPLKWGKGK